jgi:hypothetical protein
MEQRPVNPGGDQGQREANQGGDLVLGQFGCEHGLNI